jgi:peptide/nickel transport system permease protein
MAGNTVKANLRRRKIKEFVRQVLANKMALFGTAVLLLFILVAIFGPLLVPFSVMEFGEVEDMLNPPGPGHPLGTDDMGRDVLGYLIAGSRISLLVGALATGISMVIGTVIGIVSGYSGKAVDNVPGCP